MNEEAKNGMNEENIENTEKQGMEGTSQDAQEQNAAQERTEEILGTNIAEESSEESTQREEETSPPSENLPAESAQPASEPEKSGTESVPEDKKTEDTPDNNITSEEVKTEETAPRQDVPAAGTGDKSPDEPEAKQETPSEIPPVVTPEVKKDEPKDEKIKETPEKIDLEKIEAREKARAEEKKLEEEKINAVIDRLKEYKENKKPIEVIVKARIRGGLRVEYEGASLFLPASHFSMKKSPSEEELVDAIGHKIEVVVHEIHDNQQVRNSIIVSRKSILEEAFWSKLQKGAVVEGKVSSIATFGVFVDLGGLEGLIHISRLSQLHVEDPSKLVNKGDTIKAVVHDVDREKNRISLSRKELEESPWKGMAEKYPEDSVQKGIVRRITDFGAYVELQPGIDGLLRMPEMSWKKRIKHPSELFKPGDEIEVYILNVNENKQTVSLSYKRTRPNPWHGLIEKYPVGSEQDGKVFQVVPQGAVITVNDEVDGFIPRSKVKNIMKGKKMPFKEGDEIKVLISDIVPDDESLILEPKVEARAAYSSGGKGSKGFKEQAGSSGGTFTFDDFLSEDQKKELMKSLK